MLFVKIRKFIKWKAAALISMQMHCKMWRICRIFAWTFSVWHFSETCTESDGYLHISVEVCTGMHVETVVSMQDFLNEKYSPLSSCHEWILANQLIYIFFNLRGFARKMSLRRTMPLPFATLLSVLLLLYSSHLWLKILNERCVVSYVASRYTMSLAIYWF